MATAFQPDAFQSDAFQVEEGAEDPALAAALAQIAELQEQLRRCQKRARGSQFDRNMERIAETKRNNDLIMALVGGVVHGFDRRAP